MKAVKYFPLVYCSCFDSTENNQFSAEIGLFILVSL